MSPHLLADMAKSIADKLTTHAEGRAAALNYGQNPAYGEVRDGHMDAIADLAKLVQELAREVANLAEPIQ